MSAPDEETNGGQPREPRISVSLSTLRREIDLGIANLEIRLTDKFAAKQDVIRLEQDLRLVSAAAEARMEKFDQEVTKLRDQKADREAEDEIKKLQEDKAGRDAVTDFKKWVTGGALLGTVFLLLQILLTVWIITHPAHAHATG